MTKFLKNLEDPERPLFGPNYWILKRMGFIEPKHLVFRVINFCIHQIVLVFVITQYMELYTIRTDLGMVLVNLQISMLSVVCVVKANTFLYWQKSWKEVISYVTDEDKRERQTDDPYRRTIVDKYTRYCRKMTYYYWVLLFITLVTSAVTPAVHYLSSSTYRENLRNGTQLFHHMLSSWMPFDKEHSPGLWITFVWHVSTSTYGVSNMGAYDSGVMVLMVFFGGKLDLLYHKCKIMLGSGGVPISDDEAAANVRQLHKEHLDVLKYSNQFNSMLSPVMFLYMILCALMVCATAYQLTNESNTVKMLFLLEFLIFSVIQLLIFCWHSNDVLVKFENVSMGPYESQWWGASLRQRKSVMLLMGQMRISRVFTAGPFTDLNLNTFVTILKGAYSYYTLLQKQ